MPAGHQVIPIYHISFFFLSLTFLLYFAIFGGLFLLFVETFFHSFTQAAVFRPIVNFKKISLQLLIKSLSCCCNYSEKIIRNVITLLVFDFYRCVSLYVFKVSYTNNVGIKKKKQSEELYLVSICLRNFLPWSPYTFG